MGRAGTGTRSARPSRAASQARGRPSLESPLVVGALAGAAALGFVVGRLAVAARGNVGAFVVAGHLYADRRVLGPGVPVGTGSGYDGQFYLRMALDPFAFGHRALGVRLDSAARLGRVGYPALAWLLSGGRHSIAPVSLVAVNVVALAALGGAGAVLARSSGRRALWGLVFPGYFGYLWSLGRDLTEITAAVFVVVGLVAYRRRRLPVAGLALAAAVLCKETSAYVVLAFGMSRLVPILWHRRWSELGREDVVWALPLGVFVGWQSVVLAATGHAPILASGSANLGAPLVGVVDGVRRYAAHPFVEGSALWSGELAALAVLTVAAGLSLHATAAPRRERVAWVAVVVLALCAAAGIWRGDVGFRSLDLVYLLDWVVLVGTGRRLALLAAIAALAWAVVAVELVRFI